MAPARHQWQNSAPYLPLGIDRFLRKHYYCILQLCGIQTDVLPRGADIGFLMVKTEKHPIPFCFDHYDDFLGFVVSQSGFLLGKGLGDAIKKAGITITPREFAILNRLHQYKQLNQSQLAKMTFKDRPATTRMLDKLEELGYVQRAASAEDRRSFMVSLTKKGQSVRNKIVPLAVNMIESGCEGIPRKDLLATLKTLQRINVRLS